jgi:hypothetical protein
MRILIIGLGLLFGAPTEASQGFPEGEFRGHGNCQTQAGPTYSGDVELTVKGNVVSWVYDPKGQRLKHSMTLTYGTHGFFTYTSPHADGYGYCGKKSCHYEGASKDAQGNETAKGHGTWILNSDGSITAVESASSKEYKFFCEIDYKRI